MIVRQKKIIRTLAARWRDATCCPADIVYPQDVNLLDEAREKLETIIDEVCGLKFKV